MKDSRNHREDIPPRKLFEMISLQWQRGNPLRLEGTKALGSRTVSRGLELTIDSEDGSAKSRNCQRKA